MEHAGTFHRQLVTSLGRVDLKMFRVRRPSGQSGTTKTTSPLLDELSIRHKLYSDELRIQLASTASLSTYGDAQEEFLKSSGLKIPKATIHLFVKDVGSSLREAATAALATTNQRQQMKRRNGPSRQERRRKEKEEQRRRKFAFPEEGQSSSASRELVAVMGDGTKTQSIYPTLNNVNRHGLRSRDTLEADPRSVSQSWKELGQTMKTNMVLPPKSSIVLVSDAEKEIPENIEHLKFQLDTVHAVKDSLYKMWQDRSTVEERNELSNEMSKLLCTLVNSTKKHLRDGNKKALSTRIKQTLGGLYGTAKRMKTRGHLKTAEFIRTHAVQMVTFAKIALTRSNLMPYTSNAMERLMGQISKRCKHKWMHWSTVGLENMLWIVLVRYTNRRFFDQFWNGYIRPLRYSLRPAAAPH